jgi:DNA-binding MarR family transcriptional regulator
MLETEMLEVPTAAVVADNTSLKPLYVDALSRIERLHRQVLDVIRNEFDELGWDDISSVQALLLFNIGKSELTPRELRSRGYYLGSNVSYNLKKLVDGMYIHHERSTGNRRNVRLHLTPKGEEVAETIQEMFDRHLVLFEGSDELDVDALGAINEALAALERFWRHQPQPRRLARGPGIAARGRP